MKSQFNESVQIHDHMMNCELKALTAPPLPSPKENEQKQKKHKINVDGISLMSLQMSCQVDDKKKSLQKNRNEFQGGSWFVNGSWI